MNRIDVGATIDGARLGPFQMLVLGLCTLCLIIDGFDVQALGYVAPSIIKEWHVAKADFGPVFGAGLLGMTLGALFLGVLADRIGRRPVLIGALLALAGCSFATMGAGSIRDLIALRFATGLAMGTIIPNAIALAGEYSPARIRVTLMMLTSSGFIIGGAAGGLVAARLIPAYGWPSVFLAGAVLPLALAVAMLFALPESLQFMVLRGRPAARIGRILRRIAPVAAADGFTVAERKAEGVPLAQLFRSRMAGGTILLWVLNFMNLICAYFLANWLPVLMVEAGHAQPDAVLAGTMIWIGGIVGNLLLGWLVERFGFGAVMTATFCAGAAAIAAIGPLASSFGAALAMIAVAGFCVMGGQSTLNALAASYYPTAIRTTGIGWAMGIGRLGSILGPLAGGELMRLGWSTAGLFNAAAVPILAAVLASLLFWWRVRMPAQAPTPAAEAAAASHA